MVLERVARVAHELGCYSIYALMGQPFLVP